MADLSKRYGDNTVANPLSLSITPGECPLALAAGSTVEAAHFCERADASEKWLQPLRDLVLDPSFFGHPIE